MNIFNCRYWQTEIAFMRMLKHSLMQPCMHDSEFKEHSQESLKIMDATISFYDRIKRRIVIFSSGFLTGHVNQEKIHCTHCLTKSHHMVRF